MTTGERRPLPVAPRPFDQELLGGWIGRIAARYRMTVDEFAVQTGIELDGYNGGAGWLLLPPQPAGSLQLLADIACLDVAALKAIEIPENWTYARRSYLYCPRCVFLNPVDVFAPYWKRAWLDPAAAHCAVHDMPLQALARGSVRSCGNLTQLLDRVSRYEKERLRQYDPTLR